jgi:hypothetical protein
MRPTYSEKPVALPVGEYEGMVRVFKGSVIVSPADAVRGASPTGAVRGGSWFACSMRERSMREYGYRSYRDIRRILLIP